MKIDSLVSSYRDEAKTGAGAQVELVCRHAKELEEAGEYEAARAAMSPFWQRIGERPQMEGESALDRAEVFLRAGTLSGWIGSAGQITGAQEFAKDLISEAARIFEDSQLPERAAEAQVDLAICYWREGAFDEARVTLDDALRQLGDLQSEQRLRVLLNRGIVEKVSNRYEDALKTHREAAPLFAASSNDNLRGKFHNEYATVLKNLGLANNREDYIDQALVEYAAASFHAERAGNKRFHALVENNVGYLFVRLGRFADATNHLDRARSLFKALKDKGMVAQVDDTRARALIARGSFTTAETVARGAVQVLKEGDELSLFAEALTTHGTALARLGNFSKARATLEKAIRVAHDAGDPESGGVAALAVVEELASHLPFSDLLAYYRMAEAELENSQHPEIQNRLGKAARRFLVTHVAAIAQPTNDAHLPVETPNDSQAAPEVSGLPGFNIDVSLEQHVLRYEGDLISRALAASDGSVTRAARMLGITHQGLAFILNGRHKDLLSARKPVKRRRRSIIRYR
ncbi:MAG: helix-turn-helix domain-containing protein [bacterium]